MPTSSRHTPAARAAGLDTRSFLPVDVAALEPDAAFAFDLHESADGRHFTPFRPSHTPLSADDRQRLILNGVGMLYVDPDGVGGFKQYMSDVLERMRTWVDRPLRLRCEALIGCAVQTTRHLLDDPDEGALYRWANGVAAVVAELTLSEPAAAGFLLQSLRCDATVSGHMVNVAVMAAVLAARLGMQNADELQRVAFGGLLHDVGKARVDAEALNSALPLTEEQMVQLRLHPDLGLQLAHAVGGMSRETAGMIHQHHERLDGTGYPIGLIADNLPQASRICAVVDVYNAMTSPRPYREPLPIAYVIGYLTEEAPDRLDGEAVAVWAEIVRQTFGHGGFAPPPSASSPETPVFDFGLREERR